MVTAQQYLKTATSRLRDSSIETARLDSLILMEHVLKIDRSKILAEPDLVIPAKQINVLNRLVEIRHSHVPVAQITHRSEFYGRTFYVNKFVLEPRPETESMIDLFKHLINIDEVLKNKDPIKVADVGTGSGAIGITASLEAPNTHIDLIDIDHKAIKVAKKNVDNFATSTNVVTADILPKNNTGYDILLCNLPYVPDDFQINLAAGHEPRLAIFGGPDGLDIYRKLFKIVESQQHKPLYILTEALPFSHDSLTMIAKQAGYLLKQTNDFIQVFKLSRN